jgi:hypothetical protein
VVKPFAPNVVLDAFLAGFLMPNSPSGVVVTFELIPPNTARAVPFPAGYHLGNRALPRENNAVEDL